MVLKLQRALKRELLRSQQGNTVFLVLSRGSQVLGLFLCIPPLSKAEHQKSKSKLLLGRKLFSTKKVDSALRASNMSYIIDNKRILLGPIFKCFSNLKQKLTEIISQEFISITQSKKYRKTFTVLNSKLISETQ